ncbi:MAG: hypothetical protein IJ087_10995 [Eggerthellaceae bacterium]|nr:hypothetical protein [Eggerthellaceae bacterium]
MAKVHKSFRFDEELAAAIAALAVEGESEAATYNRVLSAGVTALMQKHAGNDGEAGADPAINDSMREHIETLKDTVSTLKGQLATKDEQIKAKDEQIFANIEQIRALSVLTAQAQELHGAAVTKTIDQPKAGESEGGNQDGERRQSWWSRLWS